MKSMGKVLETGIVLPIFLVGMVKITIALAFSGFPHSRVPSDRG
jgi:hypothetical protein